jgi:putative ABC transport system ATP-binding protein
MGAFVEFENVSKIYKTGDVEVHALTDASFEIQKGEFCVIVGESGAGKTTLLNILGGMDTLSKGTVRMDGRDISHFNRTQLENYRRYDIGFVFQFYNLIPNLTALENVEIAAQLCTDAIPAEDVLRAVGLHDRMQNFPAQLSGGEQQRVSIARALVGNPEILILDDSASALDYVTEKALRGALSALPNKPTVFIVSQRTSSLRHADKILVLDNGALVGCGTHDALLENCSVYREIYDSQFGGKEAAAK